jgi:iron-sulfur cluster assembly accessory protein
VQIGEASILPQTVGRKEEDTSMADLIAIGRKNNRPSSAGAGAQVDVPADQLQITQGAADQIRKKLDEAGKPSGVFRVGIMGGGCSGLTYLFAVEDAPKERDRVFRELGVTVVVDPKSLGLLGGTLLDWHNELGKAQFVMRNPHAKSSCSCGSSFSL